VHAADRTAVNGLQPWTEKGIVGHGVLKGIHISHFTSHAVTLSDVLSVAKEQGTEFRTGDILLLRTGYVEAYKDLDVDEKLKLPA
jgi:hypothetical protein